MDVSVGYKVFKETINSLSLMDDSGCGTLVEWAIFSEVFQCPLS